jgi:vacuolar-type H+-ATPase subunit C/Vma6
VTRVHADLRYLVAHVHGRFSHIVERERLDVLCSLRSVGDLGQALGRELPSDATELERELTGELVREHWAIAHSLGGAAGELLVWQLARYLLQNLQLVLRCRTAARLRAELERHIVPLPAELALNVDAVLEARSPKELLRAISRSSPCAPFVPILMSRRGSVPFLEAALEQAYFRELWARAGRLTGEEGTLCRALMAAAIDIFHLMLAVRGGFHHGLDRSLLESLHVAGTALTLPHLRRMLRERQLPGAARHAVGKAIDRLPRDAAELSPASYAALVESLGWSRYGRLARRIFRQSAGGVAAIVGYLALRQVETTNLCRVATGIGRMSPPMLRARLLPHAAVGEAHV